MANTASSSLLGAVRSSKGIKWISLGWTAFIAENVVLSQNREDIIRTIGDNNYHLSYGFLSTVACGSIAWGYFKHGRGTGPRLAPRTPAMIAAGFVLQAIGLVGFSQIGPALQIPVIAEIESSPHASKGSQNQHPADGPSSSVSFKVRCPMDFRPKDIPADGIHGLERVSRHATFWSLGLFCLGRAATTVFLPEVVFNTWPIIFAFIGGEHQDYRFRRGSGGWLTPEKDDITSNIPFLALISGKQSWTALKDEIKWTNAGLAVLAALPLTMRQIRRCRIV